MDMTREEFIDACRNVVALADVVDRWKDREDSRGIAIHYQIYEDIREQARRMGIGFNNA